MAQWHSVSNASNWDTSGPTAGNHPIACGVVAATCIKRALRRRRKIPPPTAATAEYRKESDPILPATEAAATK
jgi:hypothetical protein